MDLNPNLKFDEIIVRYAAMMAFGIIGGMLHNYWFIAPAMFTFLTAILGWSPWKAYMKSRKPKSYKNENIVLQHKTAH